jgi:hypothetical protein
MDKKKLLSSPLILLMAVASVSAAVTIYATMVGYLYVTQKPVAVWLTPSYYSLNVYTASIYDVSARITNMVANKTFELATKISGYYYDPYGAWNDIFPYVTVLYLDYATHTPLPDVDNDTKPEIFAPIGDTYFYVEIIIQPIPDLSYGHVYIETALVEETP